MSGRRAGVSAVALTMLGVGMVLLMVMFAARSGPERIFAGPLHDPSIPPFTPTLPPRRFPENHGNGQGLLHVNAFFASLGWVVKIALAVCVLWLAYLGVRLLVERLQGLRVWTRHPTPEPVDFDVLDDPEQLADEIHRDSDAQLDLLLAGLPRNAIVACWDRFEEQAERVDASRKDWETSSEFTLRLLDAVSADASAVARLEALYREARFSDHEIEEEQRQAAVTALRAIHASLGVGARS